MSDQDWRVRALAAGDRSLWAAIACTCRTGTVGIPRRVEIDRQRGADGGIAMRSSAAQHDDRGGRQWGYHAEGCLLA
jgi:hypothetical protein